MDSLTQSIENWIKGMLTDGIISNFRGMFEAVNTEIGNIASQVGQTPKGWNQGIFDMIQSLSETVIIPIAGMILTFVMCYELISMFIDRNNMHDIDTFVFFKWIFKTFVAVYMITNTFNIIMAVFELAQNVINQSSVEIQGSLDMVLALENLEATLQTMPWGEMLGLYLESAIMSIAMKVISMLVFIIVYGRMIEIYLTISIAPIPFSTMANREWGQMGTSYLKSLFALAFQGFMMMVCVAIYAVLLQGITSSDNIHVAIWGCAGYTVLLCFMLFKTGSITKNVFGSH